jgi:hypothetical protein
MPAIDSCSDANDPELGQPAENDTNTSAAALAQPFSARTEHLLVETHDPTSRRAAGYRGIFAEVKRRIAIVVCAVGCGPSGPDAGTGSASAGDTSTSADTTPTAGESPTADESPTAEASASADTTTDASASADASSSSGPVEGTSSSTGDGWTYDAGQTWSDAQCGRDGARAFIELYPIDDDPTCLASPAINDVLVLAVEPWDGFGGTFPVGPDGPGRASDTGAGFQSYTGELTLEVTEQWTLVAVDFDLVAPDSEHHGSADLSECMSDPGEPPCP